MAYPSAFKDVDRDSKLATVNMWQTTFPDLPYPVMEMAFDKYRRAAKFPPTVADMTEELSTLYYVAFGDAAIAKTYGDRKGFEKAMWVADMTEKFRKGAENPVNYGLITGETVTGTIGYEPMRLNGGGGMKNEAL